MVHGVVFISIALVNSIVSSPHIRVYYRASLNVPGNHITHRLSTPILNCYKEHSSLGCSLDSTNYPHVFNTMSSVSMLILRVWINCHSHRNVGSKSQHWKPTIEFFIVL